MIDVGRGSDLLMHGELDVGAHGPRPVVKMSLVCMPRWFSKWGAGSRLCGEDVIAWMVG